MDKVELLKKLVSIYSPSGKEGKIGVYLCEAMNQMGLDASIDEVGNVIGTAGTGETNVVLLGHIDTVEGIIDVRETDGMLYGRGTVDAKGSIAAFVSAVYEVREILNKRVTVIGCVEEEIESRGALNVIDKFNPDYVVIGEPSGTNGITLGYMGILRVVYSMEKEQCHHSGREVSPAAAGIVFWNMIERFCQNYSKGKKLFESLIPTLVSINTDNDEYAQKMHLDVNLRLPVDFDVERFKEYILSEKGEGGVTFGVNYPAVRKGKNNPLVRAFMKAIRKQGETPVFKYKTGTTDMNTVALKWKCPIITYGPGNSALDHAPNEHISIDEYLKSIEIIKTALLEL